VVGAEGPGAIYRLDRGRGHRPWVPGGGRPLAESPYGVVTDVMAEDPAGHRSLSAPTPQVAAFLSAAYQFDDVQVATRGARRSVRCWTVQAGPLQLFWFTIGRRTLWAGCSGWCRPPWPEPPGGWACWIFPPAGCCQGSAPGAVPATDAASRTAGTICTPSSWPTPPSTVMISARCERCSHRSVGFGLGSVPARPSWSTSPRRSSRQLPGGYAIDRRGTRPGAASG
jgi:hypothetical protein